MTLTESQSMMKNTNTCKVGGDGRVSSFLFWNQTDKGEEDKVRIGRKKKNS